MKRVIHMTAVYSPHQQTGREKLTTKRKKKYKNLYDSGNTRTGNCASAERIFSCRSLRGLKRKSFTAIFSTSALSPRAFFFSVYIQCTNDFKDSKALRLILVESCSGQGLGTGREFKNYVTL